VCYTSPSMESEGVGVYQDPRAPYLYHPFDLRPLIAALVSDCSVRLRTTGPNRMIFFLIETLGWGREDLPEESWACYESRVSGELQSRRRDSTGDLPTTAEQTRTGCAGDTDATWKRCRRSSRSTHLHATDPAPSPSPIQRSCP